MQIFLNKFNRTIKIYKKYYKFLGIFKQILSKCKNLKSFIKIMRIVNEILLKILEKLNKNKSKKVFESWKTTCRKLETDYVHCWKYETY